MADIFDVQTALQAAVVATLYPTGSPPSTLGIPVKIYPGWPDPITLSADLKPTGSNSPPNGPPLALHVSIYPLAANRDTTRYSADWCEAPLPAATYTLTQAGQTVTVGGAAPSTYSPQNLAVFVNGVPFVTTATAGQSTTSLAAALKALIVAAVAGTTVSGAVITLPTGARIGPLRVGVTGSASKEVGRQEQQFQISVWADTPTNRSAVASAIDPVLRDTPRLTLPDGSIARLKHVGGTDNDFDQKQGIYRRDLIFAVEFATTRALIAPQIVAQATQLEDPQGDLLTTTYS